ncbi:VCBS domain-containing protein [Brevundimonas sp. Root1279]|uniref:VCBS domain-containing protein n=1 Tax=Brevundimonas sp. Root1279 TaxID=1736443 RepID=UPI0006F698CE|nr:VCBS domain-containing protein [Brevundimonas sp. Root1279]KQW78746.1 hypothetical protein ASC65_15630 [Brevundimonas sp. Root1279]
MPYVANPNHLTRFAQGFEAADASGVLFFGSGSLTPAGAGDEAHALLHGPGPYTQFDGYRRAFNDGFDASVQVYLDAGWSNGEGFNFTVAVNDQNGTHRRDFAFHVAMDDGQLMIGVNTGSPATPMTDLELRPHAVITESGWYTLAHSFQANEDGVLEVVLSVIDAEGGVVFTQTISDPSDLIASQIGGNRYGWFTANTVEGGLAIDDLTLTTADTNPFIVKSGRDLLGSFATFEEALAAVQCGAFGGGALSILETGGGVMGLFGSSDGDTLTGGDGNDFIDGRGGNDVIDGGDGYDTVHIASSLSDVVVDFGAGTITHDGEVDSISNVENVTVGAGVTLVTAFDANDLPDDVVEMEGGEGFQTLNIQVSNLTASDVVRMESAGETIELDLDGDGDVDMVVSGMDEIVLNGQHIVLEGDFGATGLSDDTVIMNGTGANDILDGRLMTSSESIEANGGAGNDLIYGAGGEDLFDGGAGSDNVYGGLGDDVFVGTVDGVGDNYRGEGGSDTVDYSAATGAMNINLNNAASGGGVGTDQLFSIENAIGSTHNDSISGSSVANVITGGGGDDTINGNGGLDTVVINANAGDVTAVQGSFRITVTSGDGVDVLRNVEFIQFNDALIQVDGSTGNAYAYGADDSAFAAENCGASGNVLCNDIEIENETMTVSGARAGLEAAGGSMTVISGATVIVGTYGTLTINADGSYDYEITDETLSAGQFVEEAFTYHVNDATGQGSDAALVFCVMGSNDAPTVTSATNGTILEDTNASTSGTVAFADVDALDTHTVDSEAACVGYVGEFIAMITEAGQVEWTFEVDPADIQGLAAGQSVVQTYTVTVRDGNGGCVEQDVTVTLTGVNDTPTGSDAEVQVDENATLGGYMVASDVDGDDIVSYQLTDEAPAGLSFDDETGEYSFVPGPEFEHLNVGDTATVTFSYTATDENGVTSEPSTITITVNGTNDGPVATTTTGAATEDVAHTGSVSATDADDDAVLTYALSGEAPAGLEFNADGTYSLDTSTFDSLAAGQTTTVSFDYTVTDENETTSAPQTVTVTVTGTNDDPTITAATVVSGSVTEADTPEGGVVEAGSLNTTLGTATVLDRDAFRIAPNVDVANDGLPTLRVNYGAEGYTGEYLRIELVAGEVVTLDIDYANSGDDLHANVLDAAGNPIYYFAHEETDMMSGAQSAFGSFLATYTGTYYIQLYDNGPSGSVGTALHVSIDNWLAAPHGTGGSSTERSAEGSFTYADLDTTDTHTVSVSGDEDYAGELSAVINSAGTVEWEWTADASELQFAAEGEVIEQVYTVTVDDGNGGTVEQTVTITITGENDGVTITDVTGDGSIAEDDAIADGISGTIAFTDVDLSDEHTVESEANGVDYVGDFSASIDEDGNVTWSLDIDDAILNALNEGESIVQSYDVTVSDGNGGTDTETVSITITGTDDAPVFTADMISTEEDDYAAGVFTAVDPEAEGAITFSVVGETPTGFSLTSNGAWTYTATDASFDELETDESASAEVTIRATDATGAYTEQVIILTVDGVSYAPVAVDVSDEVDEDSSISGSVSATDAEDDAEDLTYELVGDAPAGLTFNPDGTWTFDASSYDSLSGGDSLPVTVDYIAIDSGGLESAPQTLTITVIGANDDPTADDASIPLSEDDGIYDGQVTGDDAEGQMASWSIVGEAPTGLEFESDGSYTFDPSAYALGAGQTQEVSFQYTGTDEDGGVSEPATVTFTITGVNDAPVASDFADEVAEDSSINGSVAGSEDDDNLATDEEDGTDLTFELVGEAPEGLTFNPDGTWSFDAGAYDDLAGGQTEEVEVEYVAVDSEGTPSETRTLTITVTGSNDEPEVDADDVSLDEGEVLLTGQVSGDDVDGSIVSYQLVGEEPEGLTFNPDGSYSFDAAGFDLSEGQSEEVTFTFTGTDNSGGVSEPHTVTITVNGVNDAPIASEDTITLTENETATGSAEASDSDGTVVSWDLVDEAPAGLTWDSETGEWSFDASVAHQGLDSGETATVEVTYTVTDNNGAESEQRTLTFEISGVNDAPVAADSTNEATEPGSINGSVSATDADGEALTYALVGETPEWLTFNSDGTYTVDSSYFELPEGETQDVSFQFTANDGDADSAPATVTVTVTGANDGPDADNDYVCIDEDGSASGTLDASDLDGTVVSWNLVDDAPAGLTWDSETGAWTFDASGLYDSLDEGDSETVVISYTVTDDSGAVSEERTLTIDINGVNDAPAGDASSIAVTEDSEAEGSVSASDADDSVLTYAVSGETPEWLTFNSDGAYSIDGSYFELAEGDTTEVSFDFIVNDGDADSEPQTVTVTVTGANDLPTAGSVCDDVAEDSEISGNLVGDDVDGSIVSYQLTGEAPAGLSIDGETGVYTFDADSYDWLADGEETTVSATYTVTDNNTGVSEERTLYINITGSNDGPVAGVNSETSVTEGDTLWGQLDATDVDSESLVYSLTSAAPTGLTFGSDGCYSFDASSYTYLNQGQSLDVSFTYIAADESGAETEQRTVTITINGAINVVNMLDGGDSYTGVAADEDITGGDSDDFINAGAGANIVHGGEGDDQIIAGSGHDELHGDAGDDTLNGGSGNDVLRGGEGNDFVNGGSGDDLVYSDAGDDDLRGGTASNDTISFENTLNGITVNLSNGGFQHTGDGFDMITGFENVIGSAYNDTITGNELTNLISGGEGNDTLNGAGGADLMVGGNGNDWYYVDNAGDMVVDTSGVDRVSTTLATYQLAAELENLYGQSATGHHFTGNDGANTIAGFSGNDVLVGGLGGDTLIGMAGNDTLYGGVGTPNTMIGGAGDDTYYVDSNDTYVEAAGEGVDTVMVSLNTHTARANVENMVFTGAGAFTGGGNALNNSITGGAGNDTLTGGAGNDTLNGGDGVDIARLSGLASGYSITQEGAGWRVIDTNLGDGDDGNDFLTNIESLRFGNGVTQSLVVAPPAPALTAKEAGPQVLPTLADDDFVYSKGADLPMVSPLGQAFDMDLGTQAVELASLMPERVNLALHFDADLGAGYGHDLGDHWML